MANFRSGRTPISALIVKSASVRAAGARPDQARPPNIGYGPSSASTTTERRGAEARTLRRSSFELTGIVRGYADCALTGFGIGPGGGRGEPRIRHFGAARENQLLRRC